MKKMITFKKCSAHIFLFECWNFRIHNVKITHRRKMCEMQNIHTIYVILLKSLIHLWKKQVTYECIWFTYIHYHDQNVDFCVKIWISCDFMCNIFVFGGVKPTAALLRRKTNKMILPISFLTNDLQYLLTRFITFTHNSN